MELKKKIKHNYTSELELKSLLIRIKNERGEVRFSGADNVKINKYIRRHIVINDLKNCDPIKKKRIKAKLKDTIVHLSENTEVDPLSFERFGDIILLMIQKILTKPQFSGYTYKDDFYSDSVYKILKYLDNYNHKLISTITGLPVNAFAYISQIIHNSIVFIIKKKKKENDDYKRYLSTEYISRIKLKGFDWYITDDLLDKKELNSEVMKELENDDPNLDIIHKTHSVTVKILTNLYDEVVNLSSAIDAAEYLTIYYPEDYRISFEEYEKLSPLLKGKVSIMREEL